jgi:hypothetical protein
MRGVMLRCSGFSTAQVTSGNISGFTDAATVDTALTFSGSAGNPVPNGLMVMALAASDGTAATVSGYSTTPSTSAWTELYDANNGTNIALAGAYVVSNIDSTVTQFGATLSASLDNHTGVFMIFRAEFPSTGTNTLLSVSPANFSQNGVAGITGTNALLAVSPEFPTQSGRGTSPTQWSNDTKPTTNWSNET